MNKDLISISLNRSLYNPRLPTWSNTTGNPEAYSLHYLMDDQKSINAHYETIETIVESANIKSASYTGTCVYTANDFKPTITVESLNAGLRRQFKAPPAAFPLKLIHLSKASHEFVQGTLNAEAAQVITKHVVRLVKRFAHPPVTINRWEIKLDGIREPIIALIAVPADKSGQLIRVHMIYAPGAINECTIFDFLGKIMNYDPMEISGV